MNRSYFVSIILIIIGGLAGNVLRYMERPPDRVVNFEKIPAHHAGCFGAEEQLQDFANDVLQADVTTLRDYSCPDQTSLQLFIAYFKSQKYGSQIHSPKHCLPGGGWRIEDIRPYKMQLTEGRTAEINSLIISASGYKAVMLYWYETRSGPIRNEYQLKFDLVKNALLLRPTDAAIIRVTVYADYGDVTAAREKGVEFLRAFYPFIEKSLPF